MIGVAQEDIVTGESCSVVFRRVRLMAKYYVLCLKMIGKAIQVHGRLHTDSRGFVISHIS